MSRGLVAAAALAAGSLAATTVLAQTTPAGVPDRVTAAPLQYYGGMQPVMDSTIFTHAVLDQAEGRWNGRNTEFRYEGQAWSGTDINKLWLKSEGLVDSQGRFTDGQHEILYDRAVSTYFNVQAGVRVDLDSGTTRTWAALGIQGLAIDFWNVEATVYASDEGHYALKTNSYYDLYLTQRLALQPQFETNWYTKEDRGRGVGAGLSDIDMGLRLRYEFSRKFAPYIGVAYQRFFGGTESLTRKQGGHVNDVRAVFGLWTWF